MKPICVVICNFNKQNFVLDAITSVKQSAGELADILVVDNASTDQSVALIRSQHPDVMLDVLPENIGGSGGFAHGMKKAQAKGYTYITLLDNDAVVLPGTLSGMLQLLQDHQDIGVVGPAICKMDYPDTIQEVGAVISLEDGTFYLNYTGESYASIPHELLECDYVPACCLMTRGDIIAHIGGFDAEFFLYWDDIDWCVRVKDAGWRVVADPRIAALHKGGGANAVNTLPRYYYWRNKLYFFRKHLQRYPITDVVVALSRAVARNISFQHLNDMPEVLISMLQALNDAQRGILSRYQGEGFPDRRNGKQQLLQTMLPPGNYLLDLAALYETQMPEIRRINSLCRFISSCAQFDAQTHTFYLSADQAPEWLRARLVVWPKQVLLYNQQMDLPLLRVVPHLFDAMRDMIFEEGVIATDLFWNLIPSTIAGSRALQLARDLEQAQRNIQHFFEHQM